MTFGAPLPMPAYARWLVLVPSWRRLHRVAELDDVEAVLDGEYSAGMTVCECAGDLTVPGALSRLGLPRCAWCCRAVGIPRGNGAPFNAHLDEPP